MSKNHINNEAMAKICAKISAKKLIVVIKGGYLHAFY